MSSTPTYPIQGISVQGSGPLPVRREINAWYSDRSRLGQLQVSLFMQAMVTFKSKPIEELLSFFQIAGIHSEPLVGWDGEAEPPLKPSSEGPNGFCNHNMVTFPMWHRPYMLLYEQVVHSEMVALIQLWIRAGRLTDEVEIKEWQLSASQFRLPYWDWARQFGEPKAFGLPVACYETPIRVVMPGKAPPLLIANPLVGFQNPRTDTAGRRVAMGDKKFMGKYAAKDNVGDDPPRSQVLPWSQCVGTSRFGIIEGTRDWVDGINNYQKANLAMNDPLWYGNGSGSFADAVSRMLSPGYLTAWNTFSSTKYNRPTSGPPNSAYMSIEYIHNILHNTCGGAYMTLPNPPKPGYKGVGLGHMSDVPVAAFDPIFFFHHCNIDRLTAIWQTLNPTAWFNDLTPQDPRPQDPLRPFHTDVNKNLWNSNMVRDWTKLHYTYDDLVTQLGPIEIEDLRAHLDDLYPSTHKIASELPGFKLPDGTFHDYIINVIYDRYALNGTAYSILFFLGEPPEDLVDYASHENFIGIVYTFSAPIGPVEAGGTCDNCADQQARGVLCRAQVPITLPLLAKASTPTPGTPWTPLTPGDLSPANVDTILDDELYWRYVAIGGREIHASELPKTEIAVLHGSGRLHDAAKTPGRTPAYGKYKRLRKATKKNGNRKGFLGGSDSLIRDD